MKKSLVYTMSALVLATVIFSSCKKNDPEPAQTIITPTPTPTQPTNTAPNQPSKTAPSLNAGTNTTLNTTTGIGNSGTINLSAVVTEPQGDSWTISSVSSSNTAIATIENTSNKGLNLFTYSGVTPGTVTLTIVAKDANNNTNTFTYTLTITQSEGAPNLNSNVTTTLYVQAGSNEFWNLSDKVSDPQDDDWTVTDVASSNTTIATVSLDDAKIISYTGANAGTATMTVTLSDANNNSRTFTATINVSPKISKPVEAIPK